MLPSSPCFLTPKALRPMLPLFVFLPGMDGTGQLLRAQTAGLEKGFDVRCLAIPPNDLTNWERLAKRVIDLIETENADRVDRPVYLCGESFGGCLAMKVIATLAKRQAAGEKTPAIEHLILVNPASSFNRRPWISWGAQISRRLPEVAYQVSSVALLPLLAAFGRMSDLDRHALVEAVRSVPQKTSVWRMSLLSKFELPAADLHQWQGSTLIVASVHDKLLPSLTEGYRLKNVFARSQVVVLPESGHTCLLEEDVNLFEMIQASGFLKKKVGVES